MPDVKISSVEGGRGSKESGVFKQQSSKPYSASLPAGGVVKQDTVAAHDSKKSGGLPKHTYAPNDKLKGSREFSGINALKGPEGTQMPGSKQEGP